MPSQAAVEMAKLFQNEQQFHLYNELLDTMRDWSTGDIATDIDTLAFVIGHAITFATPADMQAELENIMKAILASLESNTMLDRLRSVVN